LVSEEDDQTTDERNDGEVEGEKEAPRHVLEINNNNVIACLCGRRHQLQCGKTLGEEVLEDRDTGELSGPERVCLRDIWLCGVIRGAKGRPFIKSGSINDRTENRTPPKTREMKQDVGKTGQR
jgi:hypothetical protein